MVGLHGESAKGYVDDLEIYRKFIIDKIRLKGKFHQYKLIFSEQ